MSEQDVIKRLNELYHQAQQQPLNEAELAERDQLRRKYLAMIRSQVQVSLEQYRPHPEKSSSCGHEDPGCGCDCSHDHGHRHQ